MPKKVTDKEKIERLEKQIADLKREHKSELSDIREECRKLRAKVKYQSTKSVEDNGDNKSVILLRTENSQLKKQLKTITYKLNSLLFGDVWRSLMENKDRLCRYYNGFNTDDRSNLFYDPTTLILTINPLCGIAPTKEQLYKIKEILNKDEDYLSALKRIEKLDISEAITPNSKAADLICKEGKLLVEKYIIVFCESYH